MQLCFLTQKHHGYRDVKNESTGERESEGERRERAEKSKALASFFVLVGLVLYCMTIVRTNEGIFLLKFNFLSIYHSTCVEET